MRILGYDCSNASLSRADYVQRQSVRAKKKRTKRAERRKELEPIRIESAEFGKYTFRRIHGANRRIRGRTHACTRRELHMRGTP